MDAELIHLSPGDRAIGSRVIGAGAPCFLIAEVGLNHNGDMALAKRSVAAAKECGADAVKFQNYRTEDFVGDRALTYEYVSQGRTVRETQYAMFKRCELTRPQLAELEAYCRGLGIVFFSTPTGLDSLRDLVAVGAPLLKNGSDYLGNLPLIAAMAKTGLPTILSTGMATLADIDDAVRAFRTAGGRDLILLHCVSAYPAPLDSVNLRKLPALAAAFGCPVGFSDHTEGTTAALGAVALGACAIEKHFTLDRNLPGPDHRFSSDPAEFSALVKAVRDVEKAMGVAAIGPADAESQNRRDFRLSCAAAAGLPAGHTLAEPDIVFLRPGTGLPPKSRDWLVGQKLARPVASGQIFGPDDFRA
jgi:N-acetylneuraminate synthase/N,N'-diacetyllegionaminate synthase